MRAPQNRLAGALRWVPRILAIVYALFLAMFSLDVFDGHYGFWGTVAGLFMHNIPTMVLAVVIAVAWRRELVGAAAFTLFAVLYAWSVGRGHWQWSVVISVPAVLTGALYMAGWLVRRKAGQSGGA